SDLSSSQQALQQDLEKLRNLNAALRKENSALRDQLRRGSLRPSCDAELARALKVFYHNMNAVSSQLQKLRRHKPKPQEDADLSSLTLFVEEQGLLLKDFGEQLERSITALKQDVAAIIRKKREKSGIWS
uniref:Uncharacterized protein n=1 Tax=Paramormyrops kingsleyae TaxID=1676925 RepID=A0A3B3S0L9_9TELE